MKKILILSAFLLLLSSCGDEKSISNNETKTESKGIIAKLFESDDNGKNTQQKEITIEYDNKSEELDIGGIIVKKGSPDNLPKELKTSDDIQTYVNSNVKNYYFFVSDFGKDSFYNFYNKKLVNAKWKEEKIELSDGEIQNQYTFKRGNQNIELIFSTHIPENLSELNLTGNFFEVFYY